MFSWPANCGMQPFCACAQSNPGQGQGQEQVIHRHSPSPPGFQALCTCPCCLLMLCTWSQQNLLTWKFLKVREPFSFSFLKVTVTQLYEYFVGASRLSLQLNESFSLIGLPPNWPSMSKLASVQVQSPLESLALKEKLEIISKNNNIDQFS